MQDYHTRMDASSVLLVAILIEKSMPIFYAKSLWPDNQHCCGFAYTILTQNLGISEVVAFAAHCLTDTQLHGLSMLAKMPKFGECSLLNPNLLAMRKYLVIGQFHCRSVFLYFSLVTIIQYTSYGLIRCFIGHYQSTNLEWLHYPIVRNTESYEVCP